MGKGKRNRQFHFEDKQANPEKYQEKEKRKKQFRMPKWATYAICVVLVLAIIVPIVITSLISGGVFLRSRVLVKSKGDYSLNQQMATFLLWNEAYSSAYTEYQYTSWGLYQDSNNILTTYGSAAEYGIVFAANYTQNYLREGLTDMSAFLTELVAGADAGVREGLKLDEHDEETIASYNTQMQNIWISSGYYNTLTYENFLSKCICEGMTEKDIEDTARLVVMYTKYCNSKKLELDAKPTTAELETYIQKNPSQHFVIKYHQYTNAGESFMKSLYEACGKTWDPKKSTSEETEEILLSLSVEKFRELVIDSVVEDRLKKLIINEFITEGVAKVDYDVLYAVTKKDKVTAEEITSTLTALGITVGEHKSNDESLNDDVSEWIFNSKRAAHDVTIITGDDSVYLVYVASKPGVDAEDSKVNVVNAGWKEYKFTEFEDKYNEFKPLILADLNLYENSDSEKSETTQGAGFESAEVLAERAYLIIRGTDSDDVWDEEIATLDGFKTAQEIKAPAEGEEAKPIQKYLFGDGATFAADTYHLVDDGDTSYLVRINKVNDDKTVYTVEYATYKKTDDKSASELAKEAFIKVTTTNIAPDLLYWDNVVSKLTGYVASEKVTKPAENASKTPIQEKLFGSDKFEKGDIFTADNNGTSYLVKVLEKKGDEYTVAYATYEDTPYHAVYRSILSSFTSSYSVTERSLTHPESTEKGSMNEWLCAGEYNEETGKREFDRKENDVAHFETTDSNGEKTGKYNVCVVSSPMKSNKEDKMELTVYGGYLLFKTESEANAALNQLQGLYGFKLWNEFSTLTAVTTTGTGENQKETTKAATVDTALTSSELSDKELREWLFHADRKMDDRAVIKTSSGYYVAYFNSKSETWLRTAKDSWVASTMTDILTKEVEDGGYKLDQEQLNKIPATKLETTKPEDETTAATK